MEQDFEILNFIRQNTQMGIDGIKCIVDKVDNTEFEQILRKQLEEYTRIYNSANTLLLSKGGIPKDVNGLAKISSHIAGIINTNHEDPVKKIAESMIKGSSVGITKITHHINDYNGDDDGVLQLAKCLKEFTEESIEEMKPFL